VRHRRRQTRSSPSRATTTELTTQPWRPPCAAPCPYRKEEKHRHCRCYAGFARPRPLAAVREGWKGGGDPVWWRYGFPRGARVEHRGGEGFFRKIYNMVFIAVTMYLNVSISSFVKKNGGVELSGRYRITFAELQTLPCPYLLDHRTSTHYIPVPRVVVAPLPPHLVLHRPPFAPAISLSPTLVFHVALPSL
jgi:hypothetical protein